MTVIPTTLAATLLIQLGYFLWKVSADGQPKIGQARALDVVRALITDWRWMLGFVATTLGWVLFVQATSLGDISLVQPLMSAGDLLLILLAVVFLKERLGAVEWLGVLATVLGAMALAWDAQTTPAVGFSAARLVALLGITVLAGLAIWWVGRRRPRPEIALAMVVGLCFGAGSVLTKAMTIQAGAPGQLGIGWAVLIDPLLPAVILANVMGLVLLQAAFQRGRAAVVVPLQLALANALTVVCGVLVFAEQIDLLRAVGIVLIVGGAAVLHLKPEPAG